MVSLNGFDIAVSHIIAEDQLKPLQRPSRHSIKNKTFPKQKKKRRKSSHVVSVNLEGTRGEISEVDPTLTWHGLEREKIYFVDR